MALQAAPAWPSKVRSEITSVAGKDGIREFLHDSPTQITRIGLGDLCIEDTLGVFTLELHVRNV